MTTLAAPQTRKLPVWRTVGECYVTVARNLGQLARMSWLWLLIALPVSAGLYWLEWAWWEEGAIVSPASLAPILDILAVASIAVAWHRLVLRQERITAPAYIRLDATVCLYALYCIVLGLLMFLLVLPMLLAAIPVGLYEIAGQAGIAVRQTFGLTGDPDQVALLLVAFAVTLPVFLFVLPRLSLVLPAIAMGERLTLRQSWRSTRANALRLALATVLCILPAYLPMLPELVWPWIRSAESEGSEVVGAFVVRALIDLIGFAVLSIFGITLLSLTYRFFAMPGGGAHSGER